MSNPQPASNASCLESITHQMTLAQWHWDEAHDVKNSCIWGHYTLAVLESIPLIGTLAAIIERVIRYVCSCFCTYSQAKPDPKNPKPGPAPAPTSTDKKPTPTPAKRPEDQRSDLAIVLSLDSGFSMPQTIDIKPKPVSLEVPAPVTTASMVSSVVQSLPTNASALPASVTIDLPAPTETEEPKTAEVPPAPLTLPGHAREEFIAHLREANATWVDFIKYLEELIGGGDGTAVTAAGGSAPTAGAVSVRRRYQRKNTTRSSQTAKQPKTRKHQGAGPQTSISLTVSNEPDPLEARFKAFEEAFAQRNLRKQAISDTGFFLPGITGIIESYLIETEPTPEPTAPETIERLQINKAFRFDTQTPGIANLELAFQINESEARKKVPGPAPDCYFVLDRSGSMESNTGTDTLRQALPPAIARLPKDARVALCAFDNPGIEFAYGLELLTDDARAKRIAALQDTRDASFIKPRGCTEVMPGIIEALFRLFETAAVNKANNVSRLLQMIICTDGGNDSEIEERLISTFLNILRKIDPEIAELIRINPIAMGNNAKHEQLKAMGRGTAEVRSVELGKPEQLTQVIEEILLERGILVSQAFITLKAPPGCTFSKVVGYDIPENARHIRLPLAGMADGDQLRLFVQLKGNIAGGTMKATLEGYDQIARHGVEEPIEINFTTGVAQPGVTGMIDQFDMYENTLRTIPRCETENAQQRLIQESIAALDHYYSPWVIALMQISSEMTNVYDYAKLGIALAQKMKGTDPALLKEMIQAELEPQLKTGFRLSQQVERMITDELSKLRQASILKRSAPCNATNQICEDLERRGLFRRVTRDQVEEIFKADPSLKFFFRRSSYDEHHLVLCWPSASGVQEQLFNVDQPDKSKPARLAVDNTKSKIENRVYESIDDLLSKVEELMKTSFA